MTTHLALAAVSYNMAGAVAASGIGETTLKSAIANDELVAHYNGRNIIIRAVDLDDYVQSLPTSRPPVISGRLPGQTARSAARNRP